MRTVEFRLTTIRSGFAGEPVVERRKPVVGDPVYRGDRLWAPTRVGEIVLVVGRVVRHDVGRRVAIAEVEDLPGV